MNKNILNGIKSVLLGSCILGIFIPSLVIAFSFCGDQESNNFSFGFHCSFDGIQQKHLDLRDIAKSGIQVPNCTMGNNFCAAKYNIAAPICEYVGSIKNGDNPNVTALEQAAVKKCIIDASALSPTPTKIKVKDLAFGFDPGADIYVENCTVYNADPKNPRYTCD